MRCCGCSSARTRERSITSERRKQASDAAQFFAPMALSITVQRRHVPIMVVIYGKTIAGDSGCGRYNSTMLPSTCAT